MAKGNGARIAVITVAGISSRFNEGVDEENKTLKAIYAENEGSETLLSHLVKQCAYADKIVVVGGYKFSDLRRYIDNGLPARLKDRTVLVRNEHYEDLASGYSLYVGLREAFRGGGIEDILFVEGDLDIDDRSFQTAVDAKKTVLTTTSEPILASRSVVFYKDPHGRYKYAFNSRHGLLRIEEPFSMILNSGQLWKFTDAALLERACEEFFRTDMGGTNLSIIQKYIDRIPPEDIDLVRLSHWTNCNTREDYRRIRRRWEEEK